MRGSGFLAIWSDVTPARETDYIHWLTREHTSERLGVDGFRSVRVFRSHQDTSSRYFILYELTSAGVLGSAAYLTRLNAPTPWSQRIMPILGNFIRGGGQIVGEAGAGHGAVVAPLRLDSSAVIMGSFLEQIVTQDRIVAARLFETDQEQTSIATSEKSLRVQDRSFGKLLLIESVDEPSLKSAVAKLPFQSSDIIYRQVFQL